MLFEFFISKSIFFISTSSKNFFSKRSLLSLIPAELLSRFCWNNFFSFLDVEVVQVEVARKVPDFLICSHRSILTKTKEMQKMRERERERERERGIDKKKNRKGLIERERGREGKREKERERYGRRVGVSEWKRKRERGSEKERKEDK